MTVRWPRYPLVYEINTLRLAERAVTRRAGRALTLADVPEDELVALSSPGHRCRLADGRLARRERRGAAGPRARQPHLMTEWQRALPDACLETTSWPRPTPSRAYDVSAQPRRRRGALRPHSARDSRGHPICVLVLDFVPNHTACDHPFVTERPDRVCERPRLLDLERHPTGLLPHPRPGGGLGPRSRSVLPRVDGHRADQLRAPRRARRHAARRCCAWPRTATAVRCDMAMLLLPDVIERGGCGAPGLRRTGSATASGPRSFRPCWRAARISCSWPRPTGASSHALQAEGFDYTYDKELYDRLLER